MLALTTVTYLGIFFSTTWQLILIFTTLSIQNFLRLAVRILMWLISVEMAKLLRLIRICRCGPVVIKILLTQLLQASSALLAIRVYMVNHPDCILSITFLFGFIIFKLRNYWVLRAIIFHYVVLVAHYVDASFFDAWHRALPLAFIYVRYLLSWLLKDIASLAIILCSVAKMH